MKVFKINPNKPEKKLLELAGDIIRKDGLVVYPTDTLYGIAANPLSKNAVRKVYKVKGRDFRKPLTIAFASFEQVKTYVEFDPISLKLAKKFLPGPLTLILPIKRRFPKELTYGLRKVGVRIPGNKIALGLAKLVKMPITATSANISGGKDPISIDDISSQIGKNVDLMIDGGVCKLKKPSTIVEVMDGKIKIIREGAIKKSQLRF